MTVSNNYLKRLCILGDINRVDQYLDDSAKNLAMSMVEAKIGLVCQGNASGLISRIARTIREKGGDITCVKPISHSQNKRLFEIADQCLVTKDIHECKMQLFNVSDGFIVLPGTLCTLDILMEYFTWMQRVHQSSKPVYIININGFWDLLLQMFKRMENEIFLPQNFDSRYIMLNDLQNIIPHFQNTLLK